jgi:translation initiation factor eIF-2B subunit delta
MPARVIPPPKPKLTKAERREQQEKARAAKGLNTDGSKIGGSKPSAGNKAKADGASADENGKPPAGKPPAGKQQQPAGGSKTPAASASRNGAPAAKVNGQQQPIQSRQSFAVPPPLPQNAGFASHIPPYGPAAARPLGVVVNTPASVVRLGHLYATNAITGSNARAVALLRTFQVLIESYTPPPKKLYSQDLIAALNNHFQYLTEKRPHSLSMGSCMSFLKTTIQSLDMKVTTLDARSLLTAAIDRFVLEKIECSGQVIAGLCLTKINDGDVILTFGSSELLKQVFLEAKKAGKDFKVIVLDSNTSPTGLALAKVLADKDVDVTYSLYHSLSYVLPTATKVLLSCCGITSNGSVYAGAGTSGIAVTASRLNIPVLVCCETYKFSRKVIRDSLSANERGNPSLVSRGCTDGDCDGMLSVVNIKYDITKSDFVSGVVTETGIIPTSSVAVVLREIEA